MKKPIVGKVAGVEDEYTVLINKGEEDGVKLGTVFAVESSEDGRPVLDPDTGKVLGHRPRDILKVRVRQTYPQFSVAETFQAFSPFERSLGISIPELSWRANQRDRISGVKSTKGPQHATQVTINIGDVAREILDD